jgi:type II secretion system protein N
MLKKILSVTLIIVFFFYLLATSVWVNLSSDKLTPWLENRLNTQLFPGYSLRIQSASTHFHSLRCKQIVLRDSRSNHELVTLQSVDLSINVFSLLIFQRVSYHVKLYEGDIEGTIKLFPKIQTDFTINELQPNRIKLLRKTDLLLSNPTVSIVGRLLPSKNWEGTLNIKTSQLTLSGDPKVTKILFTLPSTSFDSITSEIEVKDNQIILNTLSSGDITARLTGTIFLNKGNFTASKLDLILKATLAEPYEKKLSLVKSLLSGFQNKAGQISIKISGTFQRPYVKKL